MPIKIKVYSDYVCPYCYLAEFPLQDAIQGKDVEVEWMPFELRPAPQPTLRPEGENLQRAWSQSIYPTAAQMGVPIVLPAISPQPHTHLAFEGFQYAREHGLANKYNLRVLEAFFKDGEDIGNVDVLTRLAGNVGLDQDEFRDALQTRKYQELHRKVLRQSYEEAGVTGVPMFVIGDRVLIGLQTREALEAAIDKSIADPLNRGTIPG